MSINAPAILPRLCIISSGTDQDGSGLLIRRQIRLLRPSLPCLLQIREKHLDGATLFRLSLAVKTEAAGRNASVSLNERADIAAAAALDGVHLRESSSPPDKLRSFTGNMIIGKSAHSLESALNAAQSGVDYLIFGPVFDTPSKRQYGAPLGSGTLRAVCRSVSIPVFAIGGITPENARLCLAEGAYGVAALSLFTDTGTLPELLKTFEKMLVS
ncbi:MAG: thiamine phosphate synthase [Chlorobium sp.]|uniref:thiamine phosphate synthase n=1 Tax=Chlorobium sp. TaxID=1095 RepID=UPI0025C239E8|nr:thiamine phosphate synthase [Chlorobium sp.]MCF8382893.1 thiamine phosphate synthase [Chlorobium sp.]